MRRINVTITALAPLHHGSFGLDTGNVGLIRREARMTPSGVQTVPCISGNAIRGMLRRLVMRDLLDRADIDRTTIPEAEWDRLYGALVNGGNLDGSEIKVDPNAVRELRAALPPLSVFGAALYSYMMPGKAQVGIAWLACAESGTGDLPAEDLVHETDLVRHIERTEQDPNVSGVTPMPRTMETIVMGAQLHTRIIALGSDMEASVLAWGLDRLDTLGGKSASGFGAVDVEHDGDGTLYQAWLDEDKGYIAALRELANSLLKTKKKAKKTKKKAD